MSASFSKIISVFSSIFLFFIITFSYGLYVGDSEIWPYKDIKNAYKATKSLLEFGELVPKNRLIKAPDYVSRESFVVYDEAKLQSGYYAFMGYDGENQKYKAWLMDSKGNKLHTWDLSYGSYNIGEPINGSDSPHAFNILSDGSLIVNYDSGDIMVRMDSCSKPLWKKRGVFHHSLSIADDGTFWTWRAENTAYGHYQYLVNFDPISGKTLTELGLIEDLLQSPSSSGNIFGVRADYDFQHFESDPGTNKKTGENPDIFHPNDLDVLSADIADKFPGFNAGDLLLSFRSSHLIAVVDPLLKTIKWWRNGPWIYQHDPDFTSDGKISVYSNNSRLGRSEILKIEPSSGKVVNELENGNLFFYSEAMGKHQYLPNGNILIVNPGEGRAVQVTPKGNMIFEYNNISSISKQYNEHLANGIWFSDDYFKSSPQCLTKQ